MLKYEILSYNVNKVPIVVTELQYFGLLPVLLTGSLCSWFIVLATYVTTSLIRPGLGHTDTTGPNQTIQYTSGFATLKVVLHKLAYINNVAIYL